MPDMTPARHAAPRRWPLAFIAAPAAVAVWSGWVGLGILSGFGIVHPLPGILPGFQLNTAITLPVGVEAYGAYALGAWLAPLKVPERARTFARRSAIGALALGMAGQVIYHLLAAAGAVRAPWPVVVLVSCMPVVTLGFGAALTHLLRAGEATEKATTQSQPEGHASAMPEAIAEPVPVPAIEPPAEPEPEPASATLGEPEAMPEPEPPEPRGRPSQDQDAKKARDAYRRSVRAGKPLTDRALGEMFGRSRTWGASRIKETETGPKLAEAR